MPVNLASACQGPPSEFSAYFSDDPADQSHEVLAIASGVGVGLALSEHGPCLVGGTVTLDDVSFTTKIAIHSGRDVIAPYRCVALLDNGYPQIFIRRDVLGSYDFGRRHLAGMRKSLAALVPGVVLTNLPLCES